MANLRHRISPAETRTDLCETQSEKRTKKAIRGENAQTQQLLSWHRILILCIVIVAHNLPEVSGIDLKSSKQINLIKRKRNIFEGIETILMKKG